MEPQVTSARTRRHGKGDVEMTDLPSSQGLSHYLQQQHVCSQHQTHRHGFSESLASIALLQEEAVVFGLVEGAAANRLKMQKAYG